MNILIDDEAFIIQRYGGVSRVFSELIKRITKDKNQNLFFSNFYSENEYLIDLGLNGIKPYLLNMQFPLKGKLLRAICRTINRSVELKIISQNKVDIFHPSYYSNYYFPSLEKTSKTKLIFTVHDLIHELMPKEKGNSEIASIKKQNLLRASEIIVVSQSTKNDLLKIYPFVKKEKVTVIHLASSFTIESQEVKGLPSLFVLFVGERRGYKNFTTFLNAFSKLVECLPKINLVCTGSQSFSNEEKDLFLKLNIKEKVLHIKCSEKELKYIYEKALMFVFPSLYEGFGIPILEAFESNVPVVLSETSSLPEVAGDAAVYFNPKDENDLFCKMLLVANNFKLRNDLIVKGKKRLKDFSWEKHYNSTIEVYNKALL